MANFTGQAISASYDRLLQIDGGNIQTGLGNTVTGTVAGLTVSNNLNVGGDLSVTGNVTGVDFSDLDNKPTLLSSSDQISDLGYITEGADTAALNAFTASAITGASSLNNDITFTKGDGSTFSVAIDTGSLNVSFNSILNKPTIVSSSTQIIQSLPSNVISGSVQISDLGFVTSSVSIISSSTQIIQNLPEDTVSSSRQIIDQVGGVIFSSSNQVSFNYTQLPDGTVSSSAQIKAGLPANVISGSVQISDLGFVTSSVSIISSSTQIIQNLPEDTVSSSRQIIDQVGGVIFSSSNQVTFTYTQLPGGTVSSSAQVDYLGISNIPANIVSSSTQIKPLLPSGTISSSNQVQVDQITLNNGIVSSSAQTKAFLPSNTVSSSGQIIDQVGGVIFSSSNQVTFTYTQLPGGTVSSSAQIRAGLPANTISGSTQIENLGFVTSSISIISSSTQIIQNLPANTISSSIQIIQNLPSGVISGSNQIDELFDIDGIVSSSTQVLDHVDGVLITPSAVHATGTITASSFVSTDAGTPTLIGANNLVLSASNAVQVTGGVLRLPTFANADTSSLTLIDGDIIYNSDREQVLLYSASTWNNVTIGDHIITGSFITNATSNLNVVTYTKGDGTTISTTIHTGSLPPNTVSGSDQIVELLINRDLNLRSITASLAQTSSTIFGTNTSNTHDFTGSVRVTGSIESHGHIVPKGFGKYDLGSLSAPFRDLYISTASIRIITPPPIDGEDGTIEREVNIDNLVTLTDSNNIVSQSAQITALGFVTASDNVYSASNQVSFIDISDKPALFTGSFTGLLNKPTLLSGSAQIEALGFVTSSTTVISSSTQIIQNLPEGVVSQSNQVSFTDLADKPTNFTGSFTELKNLPTLFSSSDQVSFTYTQLPGGTVSSSVQVDYLGVSNIPENIVSSSGQVRSFLPSGTISSSAQVQVDQITLNNGIVSSSIQIENLGFVTMSTTIISSSTQIIQNLPNNVISSSIQIVSQLPAGTVSSSGQVDYTGIQNTPTIPTNNNQLTNGAGYTTFDGVYSSLTGTPTIPAAANNATITLSAGDGLSNGGNFTTDQSSAETITFNLDESYTPTYSNGFIVKGGNLKIAGAYSLELSASSGQSHIRYRDSAGGNKTFISADHDNDFIKFSNRSSNGYFNFFANNATAGASGEQKVAEYRHDRAQFYQNVYASNLVSSSAQIKGILPAGTVSSSAQIDQTELTLNDGIISSSDQIGDAFGVVISQDRGINATLRFTGSQNVTYEDDGGADRYFIQIDTSNSAVEYKNRASDGSLSFFANSSTAGTGGESRVLDLRHNEAQFHQNVKAPNLISQSSQIDFTEIQNTSNIVSSSTQIDFTEITNISNIVSSSTQIEFTEINNLPDNIISSSTQINNLTITSTTASYVAMADIDFSALTHYNDDAAAAAGGVPVGKLYRNGNFIQVRLS